MRVLVLAALLALAGCSTGRVFIGGGLFAEDVDYVEINPTTLETVAAPRNPLARGSLGVEFVPAPRWRVSFDLSHTSSLRTGSDRGVNSANATVRWFPFN